MSIKVSPRGPAIPAQHPPASGMRASIPPAGPALAERTPPVTPRELETVVQLLTHAQALKNKQRTTVASLQQHAVKHKRHPVEPLRAPIPEDNQAQTVSTESADCQLQQLELKNVRLKAVLAKLNVKAQTAEDMAKTCRRTSIAEHSRWRLLHEAVLTAQTQLTDERRRVDEAAERAAAQQAQIGALALELDAVKTQLAEAQAAKSSLEATHQQALAAERAERNRLEEALATKLARQRSDLVCAAAKPAALAAARERELSAVAAQAEEERQRLVSSHGAEVAALTAQLRQAVAAKDRLAAEYDGKLADLEGKSLQAADSSDELVLAARLAEADVGRLLEEQAAELARLEVAHAADLRMLHNQLAAGYAKEVAALKASQEDRVATLVSELRRQRADHRCALEQVTLTTMEEVEGHVRERALAEQAAAGWRDQMRRERALAVAERRENRRILDSRDRDIDRLEGALLREMRRPSRNLQRSGSWVSDAAGNVVEAKGQDSEAPAAAVEVIRAEPDVVVLLDDGWFMGTPKAAMANDTRGADVPKRLGVGWFAGMFRAWC